MNRRDFCKSFPLIAATPYALASESVSKTSVNNNIYKYYINCYIQNQEFWPLEEYKEGSFDEKNDKIYPPTCGQKWVNGKLSFTGFQTAVDFIDVHSLVVPFHNEILYEVFHQRSKDPMVPPKHVFNYWVKLKQDEFPETIRWIHPDYIDHSADGALIEYV
jgi:hypothetical protein